MAEPMQWPVGLPQSPQRSGFSRGLANNAMRTTMESGPAKVRRRSSSNPCSLTATYILKDRMVCPLGGVVNQKALFEDFYAIVDCAMSFWVPDPEDSTRYILVRIMADADERGVSMTPLALHLWSVTLKLEVFANVPAKPRV